VRSLVELARSTKKCVSSLDIAGSIYEGFHERDVFQQLLRRLKHHASQLHSTLSHLFAARDLGLLFQIKDTSVDDFGIRKVFLIEQTLGLAICVLN
jgi:hypothetical protein